MANKEVVEQLLAIKKFGGFTDKDRQAINHAIKALETLEHCTYFWEGACGKCTYYDWQSAMARDYGVKGEE